MKQKFKHKHLKQTRHLNGKKFLKFGEKTVILQFDKIGRLCEITPRIDDLFNRYRGHNRNVIDKVIEYLNFVDYGNRQEEAL